jgi:hypothetical protein
MGRREHVGDDLHTLFAPVDPRTEVAVVAGELGLIAQEGHELPVPGDPDRHDRVPEGVLEREDIVPELRAEASLDLRRG